MTAETFDPTAGGVTLTDAAVSHIRKQLAGNPDARGIRLVVKKSGCSGYMYETEWVTEANDSDAIYQVDDVALYVERSVLPLVSGTEIDFIREGLNSMFHFRNPNATAECGCGESFTVA